MTLTTPRNRVATAPSVPCQWPTSTPTVETVRCQCSRRGRMTLLMRSYGNGAALMWTCEHEGDGAWHARRVARAAA